MKLTDAYWGLLQSLFWDAGVVFQEVGMTLCPEDNRIPRLLQGLIRYGRCCAIK